MYLCIGTSHVYTTYAMMILFIHDIHQVTHLSGLFLVSSHLREAGEVYLIEKCIHITYTLPICFPRAGSVR